MPADESLLLYNVIICSTHHDTDRASCEPLGSTVQQLATPTLLLSKRCCTCLLLTAAKGSAKLLKAAYCSIRLLIMTSSHHIT